MIELPRAALTADEIAETAEFFSFGTNDLTQTTLRPVAATTCGSVLGRLPSSRTSISDDPFQRSTATASAR